MTKRMLFMLCAGLIIVLMAACTGDEQQSSNTADTSPSENAASTAPEVQTELSENGIVSAETPLSENNESQSSFSTTEEAIDYEDILYLFGDSMLLGPDWEKANNTLVDDLVMWYGYHLKENQETNGLDLVPYLREDRDGVFIPAKEFEQTVCVHFGLSPEILRQDYTFDEAENAYVTPTAMMELASIKTDVQYIEVEGDIHRIHLSCTIADHPPQNKVLTIQILEDQSIQFLSYGA